MAAVMVGNLHTLQPTGLQVLPRCLAIHAGLSGRQLLVSSVPQPFQPPDLSIGPISVAPAGATFDGR
jgi:hypothetical protein